MINISQHCERRKILTEHLPSGLSLFMGNHESPMNYPANTYPFRQDSTFMYYFGLDLPGMAVVIDKENNQEIAFGDELTLEDKIWMGPFTSLQERCEALGITDVRPYKELGHVLKTAIQENCKINSLPFYRAENIVNLSALLDISPAQISNLVSPDLIKAVVAQRSKKSPEEIAEIESSLDVSYEMHTLAMQMAKPGLYEREIAGRLEGLALAKGYRLAFPTIFSVHGEFLHNPFYNNCMQEGDIIIHDSGVESCSCYASDITRTIPVSGKFTAMQKDIYSVVLNTQETAIKSIRPGIEYREVHRTACRTIASGLKELNLIKGDVEAAVEAGAHTLFMPHGIGHMLGLDVHDMESYGEDYVGYTGTIKRNPQFGWKSLRLARMLEPGFAVTVEPGIYFIPELIDRWKSEQKCRDFIQYDQVEQFRNFGGIRIEDDVLVTPDSCRVLGKRIPKTIKEVEEMAKESNFSSFSILP